MSQELDQVLVYHQATKHHWGRYARGPGRLDWATQPDPFRRYRGASVLPLEQVPPGVMPHYEDAFYAGRIDPQPLDRRSLSQLLFDSLALSAWKRAGDTSWSLRVNPSSGNLHPTEGYLLCGPVGSLTATPIVAHYAPREHALEVRAEVPLATWQALTAGFPEGTLLVGLSSIHWREAWKYGERAFRYCQHDVGHAVAALSLAAAGLGWQATLLDDLGTAQIARLLGLGEATGFSKAHRIEAEHADCLLAIHPQDQACPSLTLPDAPVEAFANLSWQGTPNPLSPGHVHWSIIDDVAAATQKPPTANAYPQTHSRPHGTDLVPEPPRPSVEPTSLSLRRIIRQRRSAVAMDSRGTIPAGTFCHILRKTLAGPDKFPLNALPWRPLAHLALFVHRVEDLAPGLYLLVREPAQQEDLQAAMNADLLWSRPPSCPPSLDLYLLAPGDARALARQISCQQAIASDGCFSLGMLAQFEGPLARFGPWFYRRLYWECGLIGQVLYLEAEAAGMRGTGIGCFFDDSVHHLLGLDGLSYQSLYHFTVGHPIEDTRLTTLPAYPPAPE
jgi:SagB-type dehydrogenase family enzyme